MIAARQGIQVGIAAAGPGSRWRARLPTACDRSRVSAASAALPSIKLLHTLAWFSIESCMGYVLYAGFAGRSDRRTAIAASVVAGESVIFVANGCRCPLTQVAERLGAERGSVTDIYLPGWFARKLPGIHVPLVVLAAYLHVRNVQGRRATSRLG
jgi:hypothetical protein